MIIKMCVCNNKKYTIMPANDCEVGSMKAGNWKI